MTSASPSQTTIPTTIHTSDFPSVENTDLNDLISNTEKKIKRCNILAIVILVAAVLLSAIGIICAIVTGVAGLCALPAAALLSAIVLLMALQQHCSNLESKLPDLKIKEVESSEHTSEIEESDDEFSDVDSTNDGHTGGTNDSENTGGSSSTETQG